MIMRILGVDPGSKYIGLAISDPTGTIANPLMVIEHRSKEVDADQIANQVKIHSVERIVIGQSIDAEGLPTFEGRKSTRLAGLLQRKVFRQVILWNEGFSTQDVRKAKIMMGVSKKDRKGHFDELAATIILQSYLDSLGIISENT